MTLSVLEQVHNHFRRYEVEYLQFAFRWMNNLLMRELPLRCTIRLWDTYQVWEDLPPNKHTRQAVPEAPGSLPAAPGSLPAAPARKPSPPPFCLCVCLVLEGRASVHPAMEGVLLCLPPAQKDGSERAGASFSSGLGDLTLSGFLPPSQSEPEGFSHFHLYVCAAFLIKWRKEILDEEDFQVRGLSSACAGDERQSGRYPACGAVQGEGAPAGTWLGRAKVRGCSEEGAPPR